MLIASQFARNKIWNQLKSPMADDQIKKIRYIFTIEFDSAMKTKKTLSLATK